MKSSKNLFNGLRSVMALLITLAYLGSTIIPVNAAVEYNEKISFIDDFDSCSGERVSIDGVQHIVGRFTKDARGTSHFGFSRNTNGTGLGERSGDEYVLIDTYTRTSLEWVPGEVKTFTEQYQSRFLRQGENTLRDDTMIHFLSRLTIDANGDVTTTVSIQNVECQ